MSEKPPKDLVAASSLPLVLSVLREGESYGYAIIQRVRELSDGHLEWSEGMLYPLLHRLERQGLVVSRWSKPTNGRKRKLYKLRVAGNKELASHREQWQRVNATLTRIWDATPA